MIARLQHLGLLGLSIGFALALAPGCKGSRGDVCRCAADCRDGLVCVVGSSEVLAPGECGASDKIGHCVDDESLSELEGGLGDMPLFDDLPSKRDLGAGEDTATDTGTDTGTTDTGTTDTTTDTGTTDTTDTGTDTTDTGTDTGTTDTGTTDTGTTDTSTT